MTEALARRELRHERTREEIQSYQQLAEFDEVVSEECAGMERHDALVHEAERFLKFCQELIPRYQLMFTNAVPNWEPSPDADAVSQATFEREVARLAELGIHGDRAVDLFTALFAGFAAQQLANDPGGGRWVRLVPDAIRMFLTHHDEGVAR